MFTEYAQWLIYDYGVNVNLLYLLTACVRALAGLLANVKIRSRSAISIGASTVFISLLRVESKQRYRNDETISASRLASSFYLCVFCFVIYNNNNNN